MAACKTVMHWLQEKSESMPRLFEKESGQPLSPVGQLRARRRDRCKWELICAWIRYISFLTWFSKQACYTVGNISHFLLLSQVSSTMRSPIGCWTLSCAKSNLVTFPLSPQLDSFSVWVPWI